MSGGFNPVNLISQVALGVMTGGTSLIAQLAMQVVAQIGQQLIQNLGQGLGLPQSAIDLAKDAYSESLSFQGGTASNLNDSIEQLGLATGASPFEIADAQRSIQDMLAQSATEALQDEDTRAARSGGGGNSWLLALARALGAKADNMATKLEQQAKTLDEGKPSDSAEFQTTAQQFSMLMNSMTNSIKTIGEALANMARKQ